MCVEAPQIWCPCEVKNPPGKNREPERLRNPTKGPPKVGTSCSIPKPESLEELPLGGRNGKQKRKKIKARIIGSNHRWGGN